LKNEKIIFTNLLENCVARLMDAKTMSNIHPTYAQQFRK